MIEDVTEITEELMAAIAALLPQLSPTASLPDPRELEELIAAPLNALFIARDPEQDNEIVGTAVLAMYRSLTGLHAWVQDVIVDAGSRGKGFGSALTQACIHYAAQAGANEVNLTSSPGREAANRLYQRMGFIQRQTNAYYYPFHK